MNGNWSGSEAEDGCGCVRGSTETAAEGGLTGRATAAKAGGADGTGADADAAGSAIGALRMWGLEVRLGGASAPPAAEADVGMSPAQSAERGRVGASSGARARTVRRMGAGSTETFTAISTCVSPSNGGRPVTSSKSTTPRAQMSVRESTPFVDCICSGDM